MSDMVEKVARAIWENQEARDEPGWGLVSRRMADQYRRQARAAIEAMPLAALVAALEACAAPWDSGQTTVPGAFPMLANEFQRRMDIAGEALAALSTKGEG